MRSGTMRLVAAAVAAGFLLAAQGCQKARPPKPATRPSAPAVPAAPAASAEEKPTGPSAPLDDTGPSPRGALDLGTGLGGMAVDPFAGSKTDVKPGVPDAGETAGEIIK
jgi:hypothetical protein